MGIDDLKALFRLIKNSPNYRGWAKLANDVGTNSTSLKVFRRGEGTILESVFLKLTDYLDENEKRNFLSKAEFIDSNWGQSKGGIISNSKLSQGEINKKMAHARAGFKRKCWGKKILEFPPLDNLELFEFFGAMLGDGCTGKYFIKESGGRFIYPTQLVGNALKDFEFVKKMASIIERNFSVKPYIRIRKDNTIQLSVRSRFVYEWLLSLGYPSGKKPDNFGLSGQMMNLPVENLNAIVRGLLDTDGHINARKDEGYKYPYITITSYSSLLKNQLKLILKRQGFPAFIHSKSVSIRGVKHFCRFFGLVGSSNSRILNKYEEFCKTGRIIPQ